MCISISKPFQYKKQEFEKRVNPSFSSIILHISFTIIAILVSSCNIIETPVEVTEFKVLGIPVKTHIGGVCTGNLDYDDNLELVYISPDESFICFADIIVDSLTSLYSIELMGKIPIHDSEGPLEPVCGDIDGDGIDEVLIGYTKHGTHIIHGYRLGKVEPVYQSAPIPANDRNGDGSLKTWSQSCVVENFLPGYNRVVISSIRTGYDLEPRGIYVFSVSTGELLWSFKTAGWPSPLEEQLLKDVDNDGYIDVVFGIGGVNNGHTANGMKDDHNYVACISGSKRDSLWVIETSRRKYATITYAITDMNNDYAYEIFAPKIIQKDKDVVAVANVYSAYSSGRYHRSHRSLHRGELRYTGSGEFPDSYYFG